MIQSAIFDTPVLKSESLKTKFDTCVVSNSFVALIGDYIEARIVQQLHYWCYSEYGVIINDLRWIYKPIREWLSESFVGFTSWQLRKAIASLVAKGILLKEHLFKEHHGNNFSPKNRTYYYSVNYKYLEKLFLEQESAESVENVRFVSETEQFCDSSKKQFCDSEKNKTKNTSIENDSIDLSHPHLPCESEEKKASNQEKELYSSNRSLDNQKEINSVNSKAIAQDTNVGYVEQKINQNKSTSNYSTQLETEKLQTSERPSPKLKATATKHKRENKAPWKDETEKAQFYRALIQALPIVANSHSPQGLAKTIIAQVKRGEEHTYWDDFKAGLPIGTSTKPEWEVEPGVPYPMFIEYLTEKIIRGNNTQTQEQARNEVFRILERPRQAKAFWGQFKRSVVNVSKAVERDRALGVSNPNTPVWTRERIEPSVEEAERAGRKITAANGATQASIEAAKSPQIEGRKELEPSTPDPWTSDNEVYPVKDKPQLSMREMLEARGVKGFCPKGYRSPPKGLASHRAYKPMPKVSQAEVEAALKDTASHKERAEKKPKTNIAQMSLAEINDYLTDPILRSQLTPQLIDSDYELITDELGQIIRIKLSEAQIREKQLLSSEE